MLETLRYSAIVDITSDLAQLIGCLVEELVPVQGHSLREDFGNLKPGLALDLIDSILLFLLSIVFVLLESSQSSV